MTVTRDRLAIEGGTPVRDTLLPYGRHTVEKEDIEAVAGVLRSSWLTTGPTVEAFEADLCKAAGAPFGVAVNSGTAALHTMLASLGLNHGDEVIVPAITFAATANAALYVGAKPVFADVHPGTLLIDPDSVERAITPRTAAVVAVDFAINPQKYSTPVLRIL